MPGLTDLQVIARGGYATVFRATQQSVGREVAVKIENRTLDDERDQRRFLREARAAARMSSHPHVVDLFDVGVTQDRHPYLIMELCDGSFADRMRTSPLSAAEARDVGVKIADALADAHQFGVLHRDVKPANILYSRFNDATLADFGLAVLAEVRDSAITLEVLTPAYAPPEMFRHSPPSPAVDVYALCATLYAVMYGKPPRWQADRNPGLLTLMELFAEPIPELPGVPSRLLDLLRYGMANDPADRPSAAQLRDLLAMVSLDFPETGVPPISGVVAAVPVSPGPVPGTPVSGVPAGTMPAGTMPAGTVPGGVGPPAAGLTGATSNGAPAAGATGPGGVAVAGPAGVPGPRPAHTPTSGAPAPAAPTSGGAPPKVYLSSAYTPPPPWTVGPRTDPHPTVPHSGRRRHLYWFLGSLGALILVATIAGGSWYVAHRTGSGPSPNGGGRSSSATPVNPGPSRSAKIGALRGCLAPLPSGVSCPAEPECFGPVRVQRGRAEVRTQSCEGRHTWETYALGELPAGLDPADHATVKQHPDVQEICSPYVFRLTTTLIEVDGWRFEVLPSPAGGTDRTFRCLAGKGVNALGGPTLAQG
ncbi:protein kinase [Plantactinospora sp. B5E13]|uniref:serine/threonine-protein kinase n=1 Tax=Plantactinospora sp. B5E13 TaxID=3153758 RepID=UPI00325D33B6